MDVTVLFLIVARGGSKRVPNKNMQKIEGLSLVGYKAKAAQRSDYCTRLMISTDSQELADEARRHGAEVPFLRPAELATDEATTEDVVRHAMRWLEEHGETYDAIMLLEPSSPFVPPENYRLAVEDMIRLKAHFIAGDVLYLFTWEYLKSRTDLYDRPERKQAFPMWPKQNINIDTMEDLAYARHLAKKGAVDLSWTQ